MYKRIDRNLSEAGHALASVTIVNQAGHYVRILTVVVFPWLRGAHICGRSCAASSANAECFGGGHIPHRPEAYR